MLWKLRSEESNRTTRSADISTRRGIGLNNNCEISVEDMWIIHHPALNKQFSKKSLGASRRCLKRAIAAVHGPQGPPHLTAGTPRLRKPDNEEDSHRLMWHRDRESHIMIMMWGIVTVKVGSWS